jgi:hypothetical protein
VEVVSVNAVRSLNPVVAGPDIGLFGFDPKSTPSLTVKYSSPWMGDNGSQGVRSENDDGKSLEQRPFLPSYSDSPSETVQTGSPIARLLLLDGVVRL